MIIRKWNKEGKALLAEIQETKTEKDVIALWHLGQCGFVYKNQNTIVYIDPFLNDLKENGESCRWYAWPFEPQEVRADYVICTHGHIDHLDPATLKGIAEGDLHTTFLVPGACKKMLLEAGIAEERIISLKAKEKAVLPDLTVLPVSAAHPVHAVDENGEDLALCYQISMGDVTMLHLGDTYLTEQLLGDLKTLSAPDLFFPPINGGDYFRTARNCIGNMEMMEAAALAVLLQADLTIPTHYDMMKGNSVNPLDFIRILWEQNPAAKVHITALGERFVYMKA